MPGATEVQLVDIARRHQLQVLQVRDQTSRTLAALWSTVMTNPSEDAAGRWLASAVPLLGAAQSMSAGLALSFIGAFVGAATGKPSRPTKLVPADFLDPRGVPAVELLTRPVVAMRWALSKGQPMNVAAGEGQARAAQIGATDPMLSYRAAAAREMKSNPAVVGYRRVPDGGACKFCLLAATQRYHDGDLMPVHPNCGCTVAPIVGSKDPGQVIYRGLVDQLMAADPALGKRGAANRQNARAAAAEDLRRANGLVAVHDHGELGPTLYDPAHEFTAA